MVRVCTPILNLLILVVRVCYGPSLFCPSLSWSEFVMFRVVQLPLDIFVCSFSNKTAYQYANHRMVCTPIGNNNLTLKISTSKLNINIHKYCTLEHSYADIFNSKAQFPDSISDNKIF